MIATEVAASWPERVDRLIVEELFNWGTPARFAVHRRLHRNPEAPDGSHLVERWNQAHGWLGGEGAPRTEADVRQSFLDAVTAHAGDPTDIYDGMSWGGAAPWSMCHYDTWEAAPRIEAPTLVIHGASSELGRGHARLLETIPRARGIRPARGEPVRLARRPGAVVPGDHGLPARAWSVSGGGGCYEWRPCDQAKLRGRP